MPALAPIVEQNSKTALEPSRRASVPLLLLFGENTSGQSRRMDGYVSHVLQHRHNHKSFRYRIIAREQRPDLFERLGVNQVPTLLVVESGKVRARLVGYHRPNDIEQTLSPWLH